MALVSYRGLERTLGHLVKAQSQNTVSSTPLHHLLGKEKCGGTSGAVVIYLLGTRGGGEGGAGGGRGGDGVGGRGGGGRGGGRGGGEGVGGGEAPPPTPSPPPPQEVVKAEMKCECSFIHLLYPLITSPALFTTKPA